MLLLVVVASQTNAEAFGAFALAYAVYVVALGVSRALNSEALVVDRGRGGGPSCSDDAFALGGGLLSGVAAGFLSVLVGAVLGSDTLVTLGLALPFLLVQDAGRMALVARGRPDAALASDGLWTGLQAVALVALVFGQVQSTWCYMLAWGLPAALAAWLAGHLLGSGPRFRGIRQRYIHLMPLSSRFALEFLSGAGALQAVHLSVAGVLGLSAIGALRGAQTLLAPFNQLLTGLTVVLMPELVRLRTRNSKALTRAVCVVSAGGALCVMIGTLVIHQLPDAYGELLLGDSWVAASPVVLPAGLTIAANMIALGPLLGLRALASATSSLRARITGSALTVVGAMVPLAAGLDLLAVVWWMTLAVTSASAVWWIVFLSAQRRQMLMNSRHPLTTIGSTE